MTRPPFSLVALCAATTVVVALAGAATATVESRERAKGAAPSSPACREGRLSTSYLRRVNRVLRARHDAWGRTLLSSPRGPTYERIERYLPPLFFARGRNGRPLTDSGVHYTHFSQPESPRGATSFALHVADGSQVITRRSHGRRLTVGVGLRGQERYGSCLRRLELPELVDGYLPILVTRYTDSHGVRYEQESFVARIPETRSLVSFVRVVADAGDARTKLVRLRFTPSVDGLESDGSRLRRAGRTYVVYGEGGSYSSPSVKFAVRRGEVRTAYVGWLHQPSRTRPVVLDELRYLEARASVQEFWDRKLAHGGLVVVPEERVNDASRNLLIQNLGMTWRYSVGNRYEQLSTPEAVDVARVLGGYGHLAVSRTILRTAVQKQPARPLRRAARRTNWRIGARLVGFGHYARLAGDRSEIVRATPALRRYVKTIGSQLRASRNGLLPRERFSSDVGERVYGLHTQVVVWQGLRAMSQVWEDEGFTRLADESRRLARKLESGLRGAIRRSQRRLPNGALFVPAQLLEDVAPYRAVTSTRSGSYWNLVMPYTLASGLFPPHGPQAKGLLRYLDRHGARLLGLVRAGAYGLYGPGEPRKSGSNPVYRLNVARFLADNDRPEDLVLSLYGQLAAEMTPGTFVSGESVSIAPLDGRLYRSTYLPPNAASNAAFLETLRLMVVHETLDRTGTPSGLELAYSTPRAWLEPGKQVDVRGLATSFGRISYSLVADESSVRASIRVPEREALGSLRLRLRLPDGRRIQEVLVDGAPSAVLQRDGETIVLPTQGGLLEVEALVG